MRRLGLALCLLFASCVQSAFAIGTACPIVSGVVLLTADNALMLFEGDSGYEVDDIPTRLDRILDEDLQNEIAGSFQICRLPGLDRFGNPNIDIVNVEKLAVIPPDQQK